MQLDHQSRFRHKTNKRRIEEKFVESARQTLISLFALVTAFVGGDYLDTVEPHQRTHTITEECTVVREITKEN